MKKFLLSLALVLLSGAAMAQSTIDLTFNRNNSAAGTDATVTVGKTGNIDTGIASTVSCNYNWKAFGANSETFPNSSMLCPNKNTKEMTTGSEGVITFTLTGVPFEYDFKKVTFKSAALNGDGIFQGDNANAQHIDFILLDKNDNEIAKTEDIAIKVNSGGGESVVVDLNLNSPIKATNGEITFKLKLVNNYTANGCFYGLYKVSLTYETKGVAIKQQLTAAELNAKTEPTYIAIKNLSYTNNRWFVGNTGAAPYSAEEFTNDAVFVWEPVGDGNFYLKKTNGTYMQTSSPKDFGTIENAVKFTTTNPTSGGSGATLFNGDEDSKLYVEGNTDANLVRFVKDSSNWINVQNGAEGTPKYNDGKGGWTIHYVYELERKEAYKASITDAGYSTFYAPANVQIPEGVKAYYITQEGIKNNYVTLTEIEDVIPANTAVILEGNADEYTFAVIEDNETTAINGNLLKSTFTSTNVIGQAYVLSKQDEGTGLYKTQMTEVQLSNTSGTVSVFLNNANKAYLPVSAVPTVAQTSYSLLFNFGGNATAIESVKSELDLNAPIYDLSGRLVKAATKGIYIQNGKKFIVK